MTWQRPRQGVHTRFGAGHVLHADGAEGVLEQPMIDAVVAAALAGGIHWIDSAEAYGNGQSEHALSSALHHLKVHPSAVTLATKWLPIPRTAANIPRTIDTRLQMSSGLPYRSLPSALPREPLVDPGPDGRDGEAGPRREDRLGRRQQLLGSQNGGSECGTARRRAVPRLQSGAYQPARPAHREQWGAGVREGGWA